jgi:hypothetical protein
MTRYFYSDPLAAAWMAKHHGMLFCNGDFTLKLTAILDDNFHPIKFVVHSDSLPLLEPRVGDLIYITESKIGTLARLHDGNLKLFTGDWMIKPDRVYIIRRDGKPFFWPESEEE